MLMVRKLCRYPGRKQVPHAADEEAPAMLEDKVAMFFNHSGSVLS